MRKLSRPIDQLQPEYDAVIVGSGYGGSIAAMRFARAGLSVCLLERGKEFQPGDYPSTLSEAMKEMQIDADNREAKKNGLYNFHVSEDISVFHGCGLGGTSLVNANVSIRPEGRVFESEHWPKAIRENMSSLEEGYAKAWHVLKPRPYPAGTPDYPELKKAAAMRKSAEAMGEPWRYVDINVAFEDGLNNVGYEQKHCINCGDCVTGCNHHAKSTLIMNYLPDAVAHGAEIFCNCAVSHVERSGDGWLVFFEVFGTDRAKFDAPPMFVRAKKLCVLAGGALGSTKMLLHSRDKGLSVSPMIGKRFTGNGDMLGFAYNCDEEIKGMGLGDHWDNPALGPVGPCITSIIDMRNKHELGDGMTFEEGSIPGPLVGAINTSLLALDGLSGKDTDSGAWDKLQEKGREMLSLIRGPYKGATNNTQTFLIMANDDGEGEMSLNERGHLDIKWDRVGQQPIFQKASDAMEAATTALGGTYLPNATWNKMMGYDLITVHPLGGCCMGDDASRGVADHSGNVFSGADDATHPGLYVLDGSLLPAPVGTNPLFTISAVAERACKLIVAGLGASAKEEYGNINLPDVGYFPAVQFTETMKGFFTKGEGEDFQRGYDAGKASGSPFLFTLTIKTGDINGFRKDETHAGTIAGTVIAPSLSDKPLMVSSGVFNLFQKMAEDPTKLRMKYRMRLTAQDGKTYFFDGYKKVENDRGFDLWSDTSTLYITVYDGPDDGGAVVGKGMLKIAPSDFAVQMTTMKAVDTAGKLESLMAIKNFSVVFSENVINTYIRRLL